MVRGEERVSERAACLKIAEPALPPAGSLQQGVEQKKPLLEAQKAQSRARS